MTNQNEPVDLDFSKAKPAEPGEPVEVPSLSQMGGTFAERAAAAKKAAAKAVKPAEVEDKSIAASESKATKPARKPARKGA